MLFARDFSNWNPKFWNNFVLKCYLQLLDVISEIYCVLLSRRYKRNAPLSPSAHYIQTSEAFSVHDTQLWGVLKPCSKYPICFPEPACYLPRSCLLCSSRWLLLALRNVSNLHVWLAKEIRWLSVFSFILYDFVWRERKTGKSQSSETIHFLDFYWKIFKGITMDSLFYLGNSGKPSSWPAV